MMKIKRKTVKKERKKEKELFTSFQGWKGVTLGLSDRVSS